MSFWAKLPCPTHTLNTGNVKFYQKKQCTVNIFTSSAPSYIILSHYKEYFFVHPLVLQKSGHLWVSGELPSDPLPILSRILTGIRKRIFTI